MKFFLLDPEVAGNLGESEGDWSVHPPVIEKLCYEFDGWLGTEILTSFPCFIVTESLKLDLELIQPSGCTFDEVEVTTSLTFNQLNADHLVEGLPEGGSLPPFYWLKATGTLFEDDIAQAGIDHLFKLVVSERVLNVLKKHNMTECPFERIKK